MASERPDGAGGEELLYCSFCNKHQNEVRKLVAGPKVFICDECVSVCSDIIGDPGAEDSGEPFPKGADPFAKTPCYLCGISILITEVLIFRQNIYLCMACVSAVRREAEGRCRLCGAAIVLAESVIVDGTKYLCRVCVNAINSEVLSRKSEQL